jgi:hypothetical protein
MIQKISIYKLGKIGGKGAKKISETEVSEIFYIK